LGLEHYVKTMGVPQPEFFRRIVWSSEEPTADASAIPMHMLSEFARTHVTMVLSGDGGDELMGGYPTYLATLLGGYFQRLPRFITQGIIEPVVDSLPVVFGKTTLDYQLKLFMRGYDLPSEKRHYYWRSIFDDRQKGLLYRQSFKEKLNDFRAFDAVDLYFKQAQGTMLERLMEVDTRFYLANDILVKVDRSSMAYGLEVRNPFLDYNLVEFLAKVPPHLKFNWCMNGKMPLKRVMRNILPRKIINQKKKGFNAPINQWFRGPLNDFVHDVLSRENVNRIGVFDPDYVEALISDHERIKADNGYKIYGLLFFLLWDEMFMKNSLFEVDQNPVNVVLN
ncbi:MAG: asparagine synthase C-terminal domain-containing protein, partial [Candidatus Omnitrophica bacterium]|nr:asparagine synthase C-terminal domain-containing protein [Candidatus Omnitrophota bacterium]